MSGTRASSRKRRPDGIKVELVTVDRAENAGHAPGWKIVAVFRAQNAWEEPKICKIFAGQDPEGYRRVNRSVRIAGHSTSIQLEATFWTLLDEIAESQSMTTPKFLSKLYDEALELNGEIPNLASMLRTTCALYLKGHRPSADDIAELAGRAA